jgi:hypothetical protein
MSFSQLSRTGLITLLLVLTLSGFGCKKRPAGPSVTQSLLESDQLTAFATPNPEPERPKYKSKEKGDRGTPPEVVEMRQTLRNLGETDRFRATMIIPAAEGKATGELEYVKSQGFHGTLSINDRFISEIYKIDDQLYFRHGTSTWQNLTNDDNAKLAASGFEQALKLPDDPAGAIRDNTRITKTENDPSGCKAYDFWQINNEGQKETYRFCIKNGYPVSIIKKTRDGDLEIRYRDINATITLTTPKLEP